MRYAVPKPSRKQAMSGETLRDTCRAEVTTAGRLLSEVGGFSAAYAQVGGEV